MSATATAKPGQQVELGRYETQEGTRVLTGRRIEGVVHVYDFPADHGGRGHFVEAGFESRAELAMLISDYRSQAQHIGACPMGPHGLDHICGGPSQRPRASHLHEDTSTRLAA
jgi:hypothetical protein